MVPGGGVIRDFLHVVQQHAGHPFHFKKQEVGKAGLGAFDLRGQDGFLANVGVEEDRRTGQHGGQSVQAAQSQHRLFDEFLNLDAELQRWCAMSRRNKSGRNQPMLKAAAPPELQPITARPQGSAVNATRG